MQKYRDNVQDKNGKAIASATVTVNTIGGTLATIYSDNGVTTQANPIQVDSNGVFFFYAADGRYSLTITASGLINTITDILLEDPQDGSDAIFGDVEIDSLTVNGTANLNDLVVDDLTADDVTVDIATVTTLNATNAALPVDTTFGGTAINSTSGSSLVGFLQSGTGAVARTVQSKAREIVSVKDFGADETGVVAADSAFANAGTGAYVNAGTYLLDTDVDGIFFTDKDVYVIGEGSADIRYLPDAIKNKYNSSSSRVEVIAHRGFATQSVENTMHAFSTAIQSGADSLECDVQVSSDGVLYCFHDTTVDALTNGTGTFTALASTYIDTLTFDQVSTSALSSIKIPKFSELLSFCRKRGIKLYPEIKGYRTQSDITLMNQEVLLYGMEYLTIWQSFTMSDLAYIRNINTISGVGKLGASTDPVVYKDEIKQLALLKNSYLLWSSTALISTPDIINYAYKKGVDVGAYTATRVDDALSLMALGVNKIITNIDLERTL